MNKVTRGTYKNNKFLKYSIFLSSNIAETFILLNLLIFMFLIEKGKLECPNFDFNPFWNFFFIKDSSSLIFPENMDVNPGPGQKPPNPQPKPKITAPTTNGRSITSDVGS